MRAHEIMSHNVITASIDTPVVDAAKTMLAHHISGLPVVDASGKLVGILSEGDFIRRMELRTEKAHRRWLAFLAGPDRTAVDFARQHGRKVGQIMTPNPVTIAEDTPLEQVVRLMEAHNIKRLPVMRGEAIVGMVARADFLAAIAAFSREIPDKGRSDGHVRAAVVTALSGGPWRPCPLNVSVEAGVVTLRGVIRSENARRAAVVAAENVPGVKRVEDLLSVHPAPEDDYGGGDFVSLQEEPPTVDDQPL
jgi:CBS domain-containing protein